MLQDLHNAATMHAPLTTGPVAVALPEPEQVGPVTAARRRLEAQEAGLTEELKALRARQSALHRRHSSEKLRASAEYVASCKRCEAILDELEAIAYALRHEFPAAVAAREAQAGGSAVLPTLA